MPKARSLSARDLACVAVLATAVVLLKEPLIVPLELVVQNDALDLSTLFPQPLLGALIGTIDVRIVCQFAGLSDALVECLVGLMGTTLAAIAVCLQKITPPVCQRHSAVV